jgi:hypothetical protein
MQRSSIIEELYWINLPYACYGVVVSNNIIINAAPIANWSIGKDINYFLNWVQRKKGIVEKCY